MDNQEKYRIPTAIWVSRDGETVLRVEYTDDGTFSEYREMCRWILQMTHGATSSIATTAWIPFPTNDVMVS